MSVPQFEVIDLSGHDGHSPSDAPAPLATAIPMRGNDQTVIGSKPTTGRVRVADTRNNGETRDEGTLIVDPSTDDGIDLPDPLDGERLAIEAEDLRNAGIPGYSVLSTLGRGGMGVVYKAVQEKLKRIVALKVLVPNKAANPEHIERFRREAMAIARLNHPNIVTAYDYGECDGKFFLAIEFIEGADGAEMLHRRQRLTESEAVAIARDTVLALSHALTQGVIHRDIKPANLMLVDDARRDASRGTLAGMVKVTDLGLAQIRETAREFEDDQLTRIGMVVGTPAYMSPEQARGEVVDFRADVYSLGATVYHFVTGTKPFNGDTIRRTLLMKEYERIAHPLDLEAGLSEGFVLVLDRMMARDAGLRYQSYEELLLDLQALVVGMSPATSALGAEDSSFLPATRKPSRRMIAATTRRPDTPEAFPALERPSCPDVAAPGGRRKDLLGWILAFAAGIITGHLL